MRKLLINYANECNSLWHEASDLKQLEGSPAPGPGNDEGKFKGL